MSSYQSTTPFASRSYAAIDDGYLEWAYGAATFNQPGPLKRGVYAAVRALTNAFAGTNDNLPQERAIPQERRLEWLQKASEISGRDLLPGSGDQLSEYWLHRIISYAKPPEYPSHHDWEYATRRGDVMKDIDPNARNYEGTYEDYKREWFERESDEDAKRMARDWITLADRYLPCAVDEKREDENRTEQCPPSRRLAFVIEMAGFYQSPKPLDIASFFDEMAAQNDEEDDVEEDYTLPRCLLELKGKSPADLDRIVKFASFSPAEMEALTPSLDVEPAEQPRMLVSELLPDRCVTIAYGDKDAGKTYFALELAAAVALGRPVFGHFPVAEAGAVVYFCGEDPAPFKMSRVAAVQRAYESLEGKLFVQPLALPLDNDTELDKWLGWLSYLNGKLQAAGQRIALVVSDTLANMIGGLNDRDPRTAHKFKTTMQGIVSDLNCAVLVNAHDTKSGDELAGTKVFLNNASWTLHIRGQHDTGRLTGVLCDQGNNDKKRVTLPIKPFRVRTKAVELPAPVMGHTTDVVLVDYAPIAKKPTKVVEPIVQDVVDNLKASDAEIRKRLLAGDSATKVRADLKCDKRRVLEIARGLKRHDNALPE